MKALKATLASIYLALVILLLINRCSGPQRSDAYGPEPRYDDTVVVEVVDTVVALPPAAEDSMARDSIDTRAREVGQMGDLKFTLLWDFPGDVDLHVKTPYENEISYRNKMADGGQLDVDNQPGGVGSAENIFWGNNPPTGIYVPMVNYYATKGGHTRGGKCTVVVYRGGEMVYTQDVNLQREKQTIIISPYTVN